MGNIMRNCRVSALYIRALCLTALSGCVGVPTTPIQEISKSQQKLIGPDVQLLNRPSCREALTCDEPDLTIWTQDVDRAVIPLAANTSPVRPMLEPRIYAPLIYGAPKPLICSREVLADKDLRTRPNLQLMWEHYIYDSPKGVWAEIGGAVGINGHLSEQDGGWRNACTVRLSHMLNAAGYKIPQIKGQTVSGKDGEQYFFRLDDAQAYLTKKLGTPDLDIDDASGHWIDMPNEPGLLIMKFPGAGFTGHTTIWNGAGTVDGADVVGFHILYWKLPCYIPAVRKTSQVAGF